jgi:hypothetical protein
VFAQNQKELIIHFTASPASHGVQGKQQGFLTG